MNTKTNRISSLSCQKWLYLMQLSVTDINEKVSLYNSCFVFTTLNDDFHLNPSYRIQMYRFLQHQRLQWEIDRYFIDLTREIAEM